MNESKLTPISPDSETGKMVEKLRGADLLQVTGSQINYERTHNLPFRQMEEHNYEMERTMQAIQKERERKEANEEAYRQETIRSLRAIEQNTANLYTIVDLISKSNEQQEVLIEIITEVLSIAKSKTKEEAESKFRKVMDKITKTVEDGETLGKIGNFAITVWNLAQPIIENLPNIGG